MQASTEQFSIRLSQAISEQDRSSIAQALAQKLNLSQERAEQILAKDGNLTRGMEFEKAQEIARVFVSSGAEVEVISLQAPIVPMPMAQPEPVAKVVLEQVPVAPTPVPPAVMVTAPTPATTTTAITEESDDPAMASAFGLELERPRGWLSLRWKLLGLTLAPLLALAAAWLALTLTQQAHDQRIALVQGAVQTASVFSQSVLENFEQTGNGFQDPAAVATLQSRLTDLVSANFLPLDFAVVTDEKGEIKAAYDKRFTANDAPESAMSDPLNTWKRLAAPELEAVKDLANTSLTLDVNDAAAMPLEIGQATPLARAVNSQGKPLLLAAFPMAGDAGTTILGLNPDAVESRIRAALTTTLIALATVLGFAALVSSLFASGLVRRVIGLSSAADRASLGELEAHVTEDGRDEIGDLGRSVERMRASLKLAMDALE